MLHLHRYYRKRCGVDNRMTADRVRYCTALRCSYLFERRIEGRVDCVIVNNMDMRGINIFSKIGWLRIATFVLLQFSSIGVHAAGIDIGNWKEIGTKILCPIAAAMFWVLIALSTVMVLVAAYMYVTANGDPEKVGKAHKTIGYAAAGVVVALIARVFPIVIASIFGVPGSDIGACA